MACSRANRLASGEIRWRSSSPVCETCVAALEPLLSPALQSSMTATFARAGLSMGAASAGGEDETSAFSSISAISAPTGTVSSALTRIFVNRPATGEGSSAFILSVITSASDSSFSTQSPSFFSQLPTVPSATDSPNRGIFIGVSMYLDSFVNRNYQALYDLYMYLGPPRRGGGGGGGGGGAWTAPRGGGVPGGWGGGDHPPPPRPPPPRPPHTTFSYLSSPPSYLY